MEQKDIDRIIEMAWENRTPFEAIKIQFDFSEADVIALMLFNAFFTNKFNTQSHKYDEQNFY